LRPGYTGEKAPEMNMEMVKGGDPKPYMVDPDNMKLGKDEFFEHTIGTGNKEGYLIEERGLRNRSASYKSGRGVEFPVDVKIIPSKFPPKDPNDPAETGRVQFAMAAAGLLLAGASPSPDNKILLQGPDPEKMLHLWTALIMQMEAMGVSNPEKCIVMRCPFVDLSQQKGMLYGYADDSHYEKYYRNSPVVKKQKEGMEELTQDIVRSEPAKKETSALVSGTAGVFNQKQSKEALAKLKQDNEANENETPTIRNTR
jgi:hypothetical protein